MDLKIKVSLNSIAFQSLYSQVRKIQVKLLTDRLKMRSLNKNISLNKFKTETNNRINRKRRLKKSLVSIF